jgi:hypothetical protein
MGAYVPRWGFWIDGRSGDDFDHVSLSFPTHTEADVARIALFACRCPAEIGPLELRKVWDSDAPDEPANYVPRRIDPTWRVMPDGSRLPPEPPLIGTPTPDDPSHRFYCGERNFAGVCYRCGSGWDGICGKSQR